MILEYHRPETLEAALQLLSRPEPITFPMGGGSVLSRPGSASYAVVDLQALGLNEIKQDGNTVQIGAAATLQAVASSNPLPTDVREAAHRELSQNLRRVGTLAGTLAVSDGRSLLTALLLAMDARLTWEPGTTDSSLGEWLPLRGERRPGLLITRIAVSSQLKTAYEAVSRSPADLPLVLVAAVRWPSGRTRIAIGGFGAVPRLAMDGTEAAGAAEAVRSAFSQAADERASAAYRVETGAVLAERCLAKVEAL